MPISPTYPGVYIDELPSAVRTITGVPTSVAAFVGRAPRGAVDRPVHITSWADYQREFGGLDKDSELSYAVYQFYLNGGSEAEIVRIVRKARQADPAPGPGEPPVAAATATVVLETADAAKKITLAAASPGSWANGKLRVRVDHRTADPNDPTRYNLTLHDSGTGITERYLNVSTDPTDARGLKNVLASSTLVGRVSGDDDQRPNEHGSTGLSDDADPFEDQHDATDPDPWYQSASGGADGLAPLKADYTGEDADVQDGKQGIYQLRKADIFNMLCLPGAPGQQGDPADILAEAGRLCLDSRAMLIVDPPSAWDSVAAAAGATLPLTDDTAKNAAIFFPTVDLPDPERDNVVRAFPPCGVVAGVWARTDVQRGVWKAPAGTETGLSGVRRPTIPMTDPENGRLNPRGINCLRERAVVGNVVWGARTMAGADLLASQWKYVPVRRLALFIEESLFRGTQWVVFEPNDEPLWSSIRLNVGAFMNTLFRQGAFQGRTPQEAYLVKCDSTNNPQNDIDRGIVHILVGFAPLKPAEFVIVHIQQLAGQIQV
ncbi:MAG TPA: phage tail sheath C-terminal domain-containing protein [Actinophytocola sp.]|uniref:phage tail sheath family protein n=1 Tax=Actinophytocola sp. TaxID=1872138 RepID=UPI002DDD1E0E|nr:phage tail sheath C-terminal domain-containing protein [Actinophytocola sp.]HEV2781358.1 phage tail sheath C-terminal domain-containing protein [Actinophytocola sp.]